MPIKKGVTKRKIAPQRKKQPQKRGKWSIFGLIVIALAIPVTILLAAESQDNRQQAATAYLNTINVTTVPNDTLRISISKNSGTEEEITDGNTDSGKNTTEEDMTGGEDQSGANPGDCTQQDTTEQTGGGTKRTIKIDCNGGQQTVDKSGTNGKQNISNSNDNSKVDKNCQNTKDGCQIYFKDSKNKNSRNQDVRSRRDIRSLIQRWLDRIRGNR